MAAAVTPSTMILNSLVMLGEKIVGGTLSTAEQTYYLARLNAMLDSWGLERLMCYQIVQESLALTTSTGSYQIGPSSLVWNTAMPTKIVDPCFIRNSDNDDWPLEIIDAVTYGSIIRKTQDGTYPEFLFYERGPVMGTIYLWPEPSASLTLFINSWKQLGQFQEITTTVLLPLGYQRAIESNFAIEISPGFADPSAAVVKIARDSKAAIKGVNAPAGVLTLDAGVSGRGRPANILIGY
mgnify:CR=1 FL=1